MKETIWDRPGVPERLKALHAERPQLSFGQIANVLSAEFGITISRCACIGKANRMGLADRSPPPAVKPRTRISVVRFERAEFRKQVSREPAPATVEHARYNIRAPHRAPLKETPKELTKPELRRMLVEAFANTAKLATG